MRPHVSFVVAIRDLRYGGDLARRVEIFLDGIIGLANRYRLAAEVLFVEWNKPRETKPLRDVLTVRRPLGRVDVRVIVVPPEIHRGLPNAEQIPFFEPIGKNVGLRRARGEYWLATNPDVLFSTQVFRFLAHGRLGAGALYRLDRYDVGLDVPKGWSIGRQLDFCARHVVAWHSQYASVRFPRPLRLKPQSPLTEERREVRREYQRRLHDASYLSPYQEQFSFPVDGIHTNASGCFLLMHRRHWQEIRGHPEFHTRGHADSITCWQALSTGVRQVVLQPPCLMFHQPHQRGVPANWLQTDWHPWYERFQAAMRDGERLVINGPDWGLPNETLEEWILRAGPKGAQPRWEKASLPLAGVIVADG